MGSQKVEFRNKPQGRVKAYLEGNGVCEITKYGDVWEVHSNDPQYPHLFFSAKTRAEAKLIIRRLLGDLS